MSRAFPRGPRLAIVESFLTEISPEVLLVTEVTLGWLESHGAELIVAKLPVDLDEIHVDASRDHGVRNRPVSSPAVLGSSRSIRPAPRAAHRGGLAIDAGATRRRRAPTCLPGATGRGVCRRRCLVAAGHQHHRAAQLNTTGDARFNSLWSYGGCRPSPCPAGLLPIRCRSACNWSDRHGGDEALLAIAAWCEQCIAFDGRRPWLPRPIREQRANLALWKAAARRIGPCFQAIFLETCVIGCCPGHYRGIGRINMDLTALIESYRGPLVGLIASWGAPWSDAAEIAQDSFSEAWLKRESCRGDWTDSEVFARWLRGVVRNRYRNWARSAPASSALDHPARTGNRRAGRRAQRFRTVRAVGIATECHWAVAHQATAGGADALPGRNERQRCRRTLVIAGQDH